MITLRKRYLAGGDVWQTDCHSLQQARSEAKALSLDFQHGAVYIFTRSGKAGSIAPVGYRQGCPTHIGWYMGPQGQFRTRSRA